jgi:hypothetical protein
MVCGLHQIDGMFVSIVYIYNSVQHNRDVSPEIVWQTFLGGVLLCCRYNFLAKIQAFYPAQLFVTQLLLVQYIISMVDCLAMSQRTKFHTFSAFSWDMGIFILPLFPSSSAVSQLSLNCSCHSDTFILRKFSDTSDSIAHIFPALFPNFTQNLLLILRTKFWLHLLQWEMWTHPLQFLPQLRYIRRFNVEIVISTSGNVHKHIVVAAKCSITW